ncbi:SDR family NAD(P)-dependent oxidoreductase [Pedomonas sp. V897]|uniref:SDR family NAD(P)-dependent oxidoreductase n=1 Tax=Pedomonas sp. V897 TaxID=3446482 RepID=UPI003EE01B5C
MALSFKSIWIVGASTGIGRATALEMARRGVTVFASARRAALLEELAREAPAAGSIIPVPVDATNREAMLAAWARIEAAHGAPEALLFAAATHAPEGRCQAVADICGPVFETNVSGCLHMLEAGLPALRARRAGRVAIISSVAGFRGLPRALAYGASKAALTHIAEALWFECRRDGVTVQVIHPGFVKTPLTDKNDFPMPCLVSAEEAARRIADGMARGGFEITFPRRFTYLLKLLRLLPYGLYLRLVAWATRGLV